MSTNNLHQHSVYRPEIDGLRAIAVLTVILFHAKASWVPSGYLGVDMFFVLSGYLITQIIHREMREGKFSFVEFYKRRAKRILPAFLTVLIFTSIIAHLIMSPMDLPEYDKSVLAALLFGANFNFARSGYFDMAAQEKPLLHIWSLSIEEQFYFVFPVILLLTVRFLRNRELLMVGLLIGLSLAAQLLPTGDFDPYYLPHLRFYELLIGSFFALLPRRPLMDLLLLLLVLLLVLLFSLPQSPDRPLELVKTLMLCLATGLLLLHRHEERERKKGEISFNLPKLLSNGPMVFIGLISYSLYLWHWVFLAFARYIFMEVNLDYLTIAICLALTFICAILAYYLIENPIRRVRHISTPLFAANVGGYFAVVFGFCLYFLISSQQVRQQSQEKVNLFWEGDNNFVLQVEKKGDPSKKSRVLIVGDSHIAQYWRFFDAVGKAEHWAADVVSAGSCVLIYGERGWDMNHDRGGSTLKNCLAMHELLEEKLKGDDYKIVVIGGFWSSVLENQRNRLNLPADKNEEEKRQIILDKLAANAKLLQSMGKIVYFMEDNPTLAKNYQRNSRNRNIFGLDLARPEIEFRDYPGFLRANGDIQKIAAANNGHWINNMNQLIFDNKFFINDYHIYRDEDHLNPYGAEALAKLYIAAGNRFLRPEDVAQAYASD